jgi:hypothetical protein
VILVWNRQASGREPTLFCPTEPTPEGVASWTCTNKCSPRRTALLETTWPLLSNCLAIKSASPPLPSSLPSLPPSLLPPSLPPSLPASLPPSLPSSHAPPSPSSSPTPSPTPCPSLPFLLLRLPSLLPGFLPYCLLPYAPTPASCKAFLRGSRCAADASSDLRATCRSPKQKLMSTSRGGRGCHSTKEGVRYMGACMCNAWKMLQTTSKNALHPPTV